MGIIAPDASRLPHGRKWLQCRPCERFRRYRSQAQAAGLGLALASAALLPRRMAGAAYRSDADWIPSLELLQDLPRQMQALGVCRHGHRRGRGRQAGVVARFRPRRCRTRDAGRRCDPVRGRLAEQSRRSPTWCCDWWTVGKLSLDEPLVHYRRPDYLAANNPMDRAHHRARRAAPFDRLPGLAQGSGARKLVPAVAPGTRIDYSGEAFVWLQLVVEAITGESLDETMRRLLFDPAGMRDSSYGWGCDHRRAFRCIGYGVPGDADAANPPQGLREDLGRGAAGRRTVAQNRCRRGGTPTRARIVPLAQAHAAPGVVNWPSDILADAAASLHCTIGDYARFLALMVTPIRRRGNCGRKRARRCCASRSTCPGAGPTRPGLEPRNHAARGRCSTTRAATPASSSRSPSAMSRAIARWSCPPTRPGGNLLYPRVVRAATRLDLLAFDL